MRYARTQNIGAQDGNRWLGLLLITDGKRVEIARDTSYAFQILPLVKRDAAHSSVTRHSPADDGLRQSARDRRYTATIP